MVPGGGGTVCNSNEQRSDGDGVVTIMGAKDGDGVVATTGDVVGTLVDTITGATVGASVRDCCMGLGVLRTSV